MMKNTKKTKQQIIDYLIKRESEAWQNYKLFEDLSKSPDDSSNKVAAIFHREWFETTQIMRDLEIT